MTYQSIFMRTASAVAVCSAVGFTAYANTPQAGDVIGNQAVATYTNDAGDTITVTSNTVETIVQQVAGVSLTSDNSETIAPGGLAFLPHIVTNEGNGPDSFLLSAIEDDSGTLDTTNLVFYADANLDGVADNATPITTTPTLAAGEQFGVIIEAAVASNATGSDTITVNATSVLDGSQTSVNTDTLTISTDAIVELVKSMIADPASGGNPNIVDAGDTVTIKLTYSSTGLVAADNYAVQDILDADLEYVPGSAVWSDAAGALDDDNAAAATDATNGTGDDIAWDYDDNQTVSFVISEVGSGRSGSVTFQATIAATAQAGFITNVATQTVDGTPFPDTNTASITVDDQFAVAIADTAINADGSANGAIASTTDDDSANNDIVTETGDVFQGGQIKHEFVLTNLSNQVDTLSLSVANGSYPAGTTFAFVGSDGITPVVGSIGPLAIGASAKVYLVATLPGNTPPVTGANFSATVTTTSDGSGATDTSTALFTGDVLAASVDLENNVAGSEGDGANPTNGGNPWVTASTNPGAPVTYEMVVENNGPVSDSFNLSLNTALPTGWTYVFQLADGTIVTNTGTIPAGGTKAFDVIITPPADAPAGNTLVDIAIVSPVSGQGDRIENQITVNETFDLRIISDQTAQASPGGIVDMLHTITNDGNTAITEAAIAESGLNTFSGAIFWDVDGSGTITPADVVIDNLDDITNGVSAGVNGLAPGDSISLIYRVQTPSAATSGVSEVGTVTIASSLNGGAATDGDTSNNAVVDTVVIVSGDMTLTKSQYVDADCDGTVGTFTTQQLDVNPGQCIRYMIEAANTGAANADDVVISDAAPAYTAITDCGGACNLSVFPAGSTTSVSATNVSGDYGTVIPGGVARLEFTVRVND